jgi:hypothetical protein
MASRLLLRKSLIGAGIIGATGFSALWKNKKHDFFSSKPKDSVDSILEEMSPATTVTLKFPPTKNPSKSDLMYDTSEPVEWNPAISSSSLETSNNVNFFSANQHRELIQLASNKTQSTQLVPKQTEEQASYYLEDKEQIMKYGFPGKKSYYG